MKPLILFGLPMVLVACAEAPELASQDTLAPAADAQKQIRHVHGHNILSGYTARPVKGPADWRKLNDRQSPASQEGS